MIYIVFITIFGNNVVLETFMDDAGIEKPLGWIGSSKADLLDLPRKVQRNVGYALYLAQLGLEHTSVSRLLDLADVVF